MNNNFFVRNEKNNFCSKMFHVCVCFEDYYYYFLSLKHHLLLFLTRSIQLGFQKRSSREGCVLEAIRMKEVLRPE